jgi:uncharacterized protein (TIGR01777 family)
MTNWLWTIILVQIAMGALDTLYHHEATQRLAWRPSQAIELRLHGIRNTAYAVMFAALGWSEIHGAAAIALILLMVGELPITLWDFVEEDRSRRLPATERVLHALMTLIYGVLLAMLLPLLVGWAQLPTAILPAYYGLWSWCCALAGSGVLIFGLRDLAAARRARRIIARPATDLAAPLGRRRSVLVTGGTGFIGQRLVAALVEAGHDVTVVTRDARKALALPAPLRVVTALDQIACDAPIDAIVNLAGEPISDAPWTIAKRRRILRSRLRVTRDVIALIRRLDRKPEVLISGSAIGWYGLRGDERLDEQAGGEPCFSRRVCTAWEKAATAAARFDVRTVLLRTGLVLGIEGGVLSRMLTPFEFGMGGRFGNGRQWMSWIHRDDLVRLILHAIATPELAGPLNATAPEPVQNAAFTSALGGALRRPAIVPVPALPLRFALGAFAEELLLGGQRVIPRAALASGFRYDYPTIDMALNALVGRAPSVVSESAPVDRGSLSLAKA